MPAQRQEAKADFLKTLLITGGMVWVCLQLGPPIVGGEIQLWAALAVYLTLLGVIRLAICLLQFVILFLDWKSTRTVTGKSGTAGWARLKDFARELSRKYVGPFWGMNAGRDKTPLFADYSSNALTLAPAGSGKGICTVVPMGLSILHSKIYPDFKGELVCLLKKPLEKRGEIVRVLNPGGLWQDRIGEGDTYNPSDIIVDDLYRPGGLRDLPGDLRELGKQILPEPSDRESENTYFREGSRSLNAFGMLVEAMIEGYDATLSSVALLIEDRTRLEDHARWIAGVDLEGKPHPGGAFPIEHAPWAKHHSPEDLQEFAKLVRARAMNILSMMGGADNRTFESFITGAQQALAPFAFGRLAPCMSRSSFSMNDVKEGKKPTNIFFVADASRMEAYKPYMGLMQWCCITAIKRHQNKECPVYFILDEATNYKINGLESLLTWGCSYGLRFHVIFQDLAAFERVYGKTALDTLLSETEIKQFLPGQRSPKTLELISKKLLGEQSIMSANLALPNNQDGVRENLSETGRTLMTEDELRRTDKGILFIRRSKPILFDPVSYAEVDPWKWQVGINPFHGKPFRKKTKLHL
jgi:type IV secretion system protein VirD4